LFYENNDIQEVDVTPFQDKNIVLKALLERFISEQNLPVDYIDIAHNWFIPLATKLKEHQNSANKAIIVGINGCQGSGKSTLTQLLLLLLNEVLETPSVGFSIDDFYLSKEVRHSLSDSVHPLFATRGVPGTHDIPLLESVLENLVSGKNTIIPVFDKSTDDVKPINQWRHVNEAYQVIILEGWCVGTTSQADQDLNLPLNELEESEDPNGKWRVCVNDALATDYSRVFKSIDYLVMLKAPSFEQVYAWRCEQEHKLKASLEAVKKQGDTDLLSVMSDQEISRFIQFYQRLTQHGLMSMPAKCDSVFSLDEKRTITQVTYK
jgi:D-glycerate 3-kinase